MVMEGSLLKASDVAYTAFVISLEKIGKSSELEKFTRQVENYDMHVEEQNDAYKFTFYTKPYHGRSLKGGGAGFIIQRGTYKVLDSEYYK